MDDEPSEAASANGNSAVRPANCTETVRGDAGRAGSVIVISDRGDVVLDVAFEAVEETAEPSRKAASSVAVKRTPDQGPRGSVHSCTGSPKPKPPVAFRVESAMLKKHSRYFANLLGDTRFKEARTVEAALAALDLEGVKPKDADVGRLPRVHIDDNDGGRGTADRELVFAELLRILHWDGTFVDADGNGERQKQNTLLSKTAKAKSSLSPAATKQSKTPSGKMLASKAASASQRARPGVASAQFTAPQYLLSGSRWSPATPPTLLELATLAIQADRFTCVEAVAPYVRTLRVRYPQPLVRAATRDNGLGVALKPIGGTNASASMSNSLPGLANEEVIRQKVFVAWFLDQPIRFHTSTRELILYGSHQWAAALAGEEQNGAQDDHQPGTSFRPRLAAWWDLPDDLESELQFRRACIVNCLASVPRHFLALYTSRNKRQCKMGYESSGACDSFQLGEIIKFLYHKDLFFLQDFSCTLSSANVNRRDRNRRILPSDYAAVDIYHIISTLKQCPSYQLDKHHVNCGLRTRISPILDYIQAMLATSAVALHRHDWASAQHGTASWLAAAEAAGMFDDDDGDYDDSDDGGSDDDPSANVPLFRKPQKKTPSGSHTPQVFRFTRSIAGDQRLRMEGSIASNGMARQLFTARRWNWTPEN